MSDTTPTNDDPAVLIRCFQVIGVLIAIFTIFMAFLAVFYIITGFDQFDKVPAGWVVDLTLRSALLGCLSYACIFRAKVLSRKEKWPAAIACLIVVVTLVLSPSYAAVRGLMWGNSITGYQFYIGSLALCLTVVSLLRRGGGIAFVALLLSAVSLYPGISFLVRVYSR